MCKTTVLYAKKTATPVYHCVAYAQNLVANCSATPDKLFPGPGVSSMVGYDAGPPLKQHWVNILCFLGVLTQIIII